MRLLDGGHGPGGGCRQSPAQVRRAAVFNPRGGRRAQAAAELLGEAGARPPLAQAAAKAAVDEGADLPLAAGLAAERAHYSSLFGSADRREALAAFAEKRAPVFQGC